MTTVLQPITPTPTLDLPPSGGMDVIHKVLGGDPGAATQSLPVIGDVMYVINIIAMTAGCSWLIYIFVAGAYKTATSGKPAGGDWSLGSFFLRLAVTFALLTPMPSGFSLGQIVTLGAVNLSISAGNIVWAAAGTSLLTRGGSIGAGTVTDAAVRDTVRSTLKAELCVSAANSYRRALGEPNSHKRSTGDGKVTWGAFTDSCDQDAILSGVCQARDDDASCGSAVMTDATALQAAAGGDSSLARFATAASTAQEAAFLRMSNAAAQLAASMTRPWRTYELDTGMERPVRQAVPDENWQQPPQEWVDNTINRLAEAYRTDINLSLSAAALSAGIMTDAARAIAPHAQAGWLSAGTWYWQLARANGAITAAAAIPQVLAGARGTGYGETVRQASVGYADKSMGDDLRELFAQSKGEGAKDWLINKALTAAGTSRELLATSAGRVAGFDPTDNRHPLLQLQSAGVGLIASGVAVVMLPASLKALAAGAKEQIGGAMADKATGATTFIHSLLNDLGGYVTTAGIAMIAIGLAWAILIPMLPLLSWLRQLFAWLKAVLLALVATPAWLLVHLAPGGKEIIPAPALNGYKLLFDLLARPALLVVSMLLAYLSIWPVLILVHELFALAAMIISGSLISSLLMMLGQAVIYCAVTYLAVLGCVKLSEQIPERAAQWINSISTKE